MSSRTDPRQTERWQRIRASIAALRERETHQWGPFPWSDDDASAPLVEIPQAHLLALVEAVEAAQEWDSLVEAKTMDFDRLNLAATRKRMTLARFDFASALGGADA